MNRFSRSAAVMMGILAAIALSGCASFGAAGPQTKAVNKASGEPYQDVPIEVVPLDSTTNARIIQTTNARSFSQIFGDIAPGTVLIERGDIVAVTLWEAPPAVLFGASAPGDLLSASMGSQNGTLPDQRVDREGIITVPFAGSIRAAGRTPLQVQRTIVARLKGKANDPQALVRLVNNEASNVTVLGKIANTRRVPLTARGERLLDVLAEAGGPTQSVAKTTVRLTRGRRAATMPLDAVIVDPAQNVTLQADDVVTVMHQPYSFTALGAVQQNAEIPFEGSGFSLAEALGRIGGLRDDRADIRGVFLFRFEDPAALGWTDLQGRPTTADGRVPVIYRLDLSQASSLFIAQDFAMRDKDVVYVSSAPGADLAKFLATVSNIALTTLAVGNSL